MILRFVCCFFFCLFFWCLDFSFCPCLILLQDFVSMCLCAFGVGALAVVSAVVARQAS